jgi:hypothetical protein
MPIRSPGAPARLAADLVRKDMVEVWPGETARTANDFR